MDNLILKVSSLILLTLLCLTIFIAGTSINAKQAPLEYCCNYMDPRVQHPAEFSYFCYENGIEVKKTIPYDCCWDAWHSNGWNAPVGLPCPPVGGCVGPGEDFH